MDLPRRLALCITFLWAAACNGAASRNMAADVPSGQPSTNPSSGNTGGTSASVMVRAPRLLHHSGTSGRCLDGSNPASVQDGNCLGSNPNQGWVLDANGTIGLLGAPEQCLTVTGAWDGNTWAGDTAVRLATCDATNAAQRWTRTGTTGGYDAIKTAMGAPALCLTTAATADANGQFTTVGNCNAASAQAWAVTPQVPDGPQLLVTHGGAPTLQCFDTHGGQRDGAATAMAAACQASSVDQSLLFREDGTVRLQIDPAKCVSATALESNAMIRIASCNTGDANQLWTLENPWGGWNAIHPQGATSLCIRSDTVGGSVLLATCDGTPGQQWMAQQATAGYLTCFFTGDTSPTTYDRMYCTIATDGLESDQAVNAGNAVLVNTVASQDGESLFRDPSIMRDQNGVYHVVATLTNDMNHSAFVIYDSTDLVTWTGGRAVATNDPATQLWAPDLIYDTARNNYMVYYTRPPQTGWDHTCIYYMTTVDFLTWSAPAALYCDPNGAVMDQHIEFDGAQYTMVYRYNGDISMRTATDAHGPWGGYAEIVPQSYFYAGSVFGEGPYTLPRRDAPGYLLIWDFYGKFGAAIMPDSMASMSDPNAWFIQTVNNGPGWINGNIYTNSVFWNAPVRHGSMIAISADQLTGIQTRWHASVREWQTGQTTW